MRSPVLTLLPALLLVSSCGAPPKPASVDELNRRPANSAMAVELQSCQTDLHNTRIDAAEAAQRAEYTAATLDRMVALQQAVALLQPSAPAAPGVSVPSEAVIPKANSVHTVYFDFASTRVQMHTDVMRALIAQARTAPLVVLKGRTDGTQDTVNEARIARDRAIAVREQLIAAGLDPKRIRTTYQPTGDHAADNTTAAGQARNRRVEIEVYTALPIVAAPTSYPQP